MVSTEYVKKLVETVSKIDDLAKKTRKRPFPDLRFVAYKLCKEYCHEKTSLQTIGKTFEKDHSSVIHGLKEFNTLSNQISFKSSLNVYKECKSQLDKFIKKKPDVILKTADEVKLHYRIRFFELGEKYHKVIGSLTTKLYNLRTRPIFQEIAELDDESLYEFETRAKAFLEMKKLQKKRELKTTY